MSSYKKGIDVSEHQGKDIDWERVKASGVEFAMLRAGKGKGVVDLHFKRNAAECNRLGIPIGIYWFSYAKNAAEAANEGKYCVDIIRPYKIDYPVAFDFEDDSVKNCKNAGISITKKSFATTLALNFLNVIAEAGYTPLNYTNPAYLNQYFDADRLSQFGIWLAQWPYGTPLLDKPPRECAIWQYSEKGSVPGIKGTVDLDVCYVNYPKKEKEKDEMTGEQIFNALNAHMDTLPMPEWAKKELAEAKEMGITDGNNPMRLMPRYQAAIMAKRAVETVVKQQKI